MADPTGEDSVHRLRALLGGEPPRSVLELDESARNDLVAVLEQSRQAQFASMQQAFEASLKHLPLPVRAIVKRVLLG